MTNAPGIEINGQAQIGGKPLFPRLSLAIAPDGWTCLLGGSGVGKTTILRLIAGLQTGVEFTGTIRASDGAPLAGRVAYMAQDDLLLPWSNVARNITLGARLRGKRPDRAQLQRLLDATGLSDHAAKRPAALSGGQQQRVALARTLMEDKPIILLDEPFSALDARTRSEMQELAADLLRGRTVLLVTHDPMEAARLGQSVSVLTPSGLIDVPPPASATPRSEETPATLQYQGRLLRLLKGGTP